MRSHRNPGPTWGFAFITTLDRLLPDGLTRAIVTAGSAVAVLLMKSRRAHSREYLRLALGREPRAMDLVRHFSAFSQLLILRLRAARGVALTAEPAPDSEVQAVAFLESDQQALFGTFHFGHSDLLGFLLTGGGRKVAMIRTRMANAKDTEDLAKTFAGSVQFVWVDDPSMTLFAIKESVDSGLSIAMQCDRIEFSSRLEPFEFLGAVRMFPFTIYHLAIVFEKPVVFCMGVPAGGGATCVYTSSVYVPQGGKKEASAAAKLHFQAVLKQLESLIAQHPYLWFNFLPLNPIAASPPGK